MKIKSRKKKKQSVPQLIPPKLDTAIEGQKIHEITDEYLQYYHTAYRLRRDDEVAYRQFLHRTYVELFHENPPFDVYWQQVHILLGYSIIRKGYEDRGVPVPVDLQKKYESALGFELSELPVSEYCQGIECTKEGNKMKVKKVKRSKEKVTKKVAKASTKKVIAKKPAVKPEKKVTVTGKYEQLFRDNTKTKLSDAKLAQEMRKAFPNKKKYDADDVASVRGMYNRGALSTQAGTPPKTKSVKY